MNRLLLGLYRVLLYLYPPSLRREHGNEMRQCARTAIDRGGTAATLVADTAIAIPREWLLIMKGWTMTGMLQDVVYAARLLRRSPGFTLAAVLTLALGIGANTAMVSLADATLLHPLKVANPSRVVSLPWSSSYKDYLEYRDGAGVFSGVTGVALRDRVMVDIDGTPEVRSMGFLSGGAFDMLGVPMAAGRPLQPADEGRGAPLVAVLAYPFWQARFAGTRETIGRVIHVNGHPVTIVGVAEPGFRGTSVAFAPHLFVPLTAIADVTTGITGSPMVFENRGFVWMTVFGRLKSGVTIEQASAAIEALYRRQHPPSGRAAPERLRLVPLSTRALGSSADNIRRFVALLVAVVVLTLLVGCANLANLLLARSAARQREMGVRLALGARRSRVVWQMLAESLLLAAIGGAAGVLVAVVVLRLLGAYQLPGKLDIRMLDLHVNGFALWATLALSILTGLLFGAAPAWRASRTDVVGALGTSSRASTARGRLRHVLLAAQVAICLVLLAGTGLFLRSLANALAVPLGFQPDHVAVATVNLTLAKFDATRQRTFYDEALRRVKALPEVEAAGWAAVIPTTTVWMFDQTIEGYTPARDEDMTFYVSVADAGYFRAAGTRIVAGRAFSAEDGPATPPVAIVNEEAARRFFGGSAIGHRIKSGDQSPWYTIVGVAENTKLRELDEKAEPLIYYDFDQPFADERASFMTTAHLFVRVSGDEEQMLPALAGQLRGVDAGAPVYDVRTFSDAVSGLVMPQRMGMTLFTLFSVLALALAAIGIYGVASYLAALRTREIGIRIALGARSEEIRRLVLGQGFKPVAAGLAVGVVLALWTAPLAGAFLFGLSPRDPLTLTAVSALIAAVALTATWLPARRAAAIQPVDALRID